jgi:hypothetical protein
MGSGIQDLAIPFLFRSIRITNSHSLTKTACAFTDAEEKGNTRVGMLVQTLHIQDAIDLQYSSNLDALLTLFLYIHSLHNVRLPPTAHPSTLGILSHMSASTLTRLEFSPWNVLQPGLIYVNRLSSLTSLIVYSNGAFSSVDASFPGWTLPRLRELAWHRNSNSNDVADARFLARCRFPLLTDATISLPGLDQEGIGHLRTFLTAHPRVQTLAVHCADASRAQGTFPFTQCTHLVALDTMPGPAVMTALPPSVRVITLPSRVSGAKPWDLFDELLKPSTITNLEEIHAQGDNDGSFVWTDGRKSASHAQFIGHLLSYAPALGARGIRIADQKGESPAFVCA